ncbi:hypothetical protein DQ04_27171000, partial [Trypanosoma grayi]|uniref:hypothetical protein n=1 Tax=Trypanosoma grayi TaxID=71804 RepID=UPI0004F42749
VSAAITEVWSSPQSMPTPGGSERRPPLSAPLGSRGDSVHNASTLVDCASDNDNVNVDDDCNNDDDDARFASARSMNESLFKQLLPAPAPQRFRAQDSVSLASEPFAASDAFMSCRSLRR